MPYLYLEIAEQTDPMSSGRVPMVVRIDVADKTEALAKLPAYEPLFTGKTYVKKLITCNHDIGGSCTEEVL